jgi:hypothetical protein
MAKRPKKSNAHEPSPPAYIPTQPWSNPTKVAELAAICRVHDDASIDRLAKLLTDAHESLEGNLHAISTEIAAPALRNEIESLLTQAESLACSMANCRLETRGRIAKAYQEVHHPRDLSSDGQRRLRENLQHLGRLRAALDHAIAILPRPRGRHANLRLERVCQVFARVFKDFTGKDFTFDVLREGGKLTLATGAAQFVQAAARIYCPDATLQALVTASRKVVTKRKAKAKSAEIECATQPL